MREQEHQQDTNETRILLVDDDMSHRKLMLIALTDRRPLVTVTAAASRAELLEAARANKYDCIVLDFTVPPYTAPELIREIAPLQRGVPCVVVSSSEEQAVVIESIRNGCTDFVHKDDAVVGDVLWRRISNAINGAKTKQKERRKINRRLKVLETRANTDPLTGLLNRRAAEEALRGRNNHDDRRADSTIVMIDLDHFKSVNDTFGHNTGDDVLKRTAALIRASAEDHDVVTRWGGEEFLIIRQSISLTDSWIWAEDLRRAIAEEIILPDGKTRQTISVGLDVIPAREVSTEAVFRADKAMYLAKDSGRDRVCTWDMVRSMDLALEMGSHPHMTTRARMLALVEKLADTLGPTQREHIGPHGLLVRELCSLVASRLDYPESLRADLDLASEFHDIGKVGIPEALLSLPRRLTVGERRLINQHARFGAELIRACGASEEVASIVARHHDQYKSENPSASLPESPPDPVDVLSACDAVVAMMSPRPYAVPRTPVQAMSELRHGRGDQFDPEVVDTIQFVDHDRLLAA